MSEDSIDFTAILTRRFRYPERGDKLFKPSTKWMGNAVIAAHGFSRLVLMTEGYKKGADRLVAQAIEERSVRDFLVYPIVFCYRHFVELSLKYIAATYGPCVGINASWNTHDLNKLWATVCDVLDGLGVDRDEACAAVGACICEFSKVDAPSTSFRYPTDKSGSVVPLAFDRLDLDQLRDVMDGISGYFSGLDGYLSSLKDSAP